MKHELGQFNIELNLAARRLRDHVLHELEPDLAGVFSSTGPGRALSGWALAWSGYACCPPNS
jgi:hypothetical protein